MPSEILYLFFDISYWLGPDKSVELKSMVWYFSKKMQPHGELESTLRRLGGPTNFGLPFLDVLKGGLNPRSSPRSQGNFKVKPS